MGTIQYFFNKSMFIKFGIKIMKIQKDTSIKDKT